MAITLQKGQKISLAKEAGGAVSKVTMGLGWDTGRTQIDLDASCGLFAEDKRPQEASRAPTAPSCTPATI